MNLPRATLASLTLALAFTVLGGCQQEAAKTEAPASAAASASPGESDAAIADARLVLPAVKGNPGVAYFTVKNETTGTMAIASVAVDGAGKAEMHQTAGGQMTPVDRVDIAPGTAITFEPGKLHVMLFDLAADRLKAGGSTTLTVTLADGRTLTSPIPIEAAGAAVMGGMDHGDGH